MWYLRKEINEFLMRFDMINHFKMWRLWLPFGFNSACWNNFFWMSLISCLLNFLKSNNLPSWIDKFQKNSNFLLINLETVQWWKKKRKSYSNSQVFFKINWVIRILLLKFPKRENHQSESMRMTLRTMKERISRTRKSRVRRKRLIKVRRQQMLKTQTRVQFQKF